MNSWTSRRIHRLLKPGGDSRGVALIMVLWVIAILSLVVTEFSFSMRTEVNITRNFQEELQLYAMAEGGIHRAIAELVYKHDSRIQQWRRTPKIEEIPPEQKEWVTDGRDYPLSFQQGECTIRIMGEAGKININTVSEGTLRRVVKNFGFDEETQGIVVDSILDWRDPDDFYRLNGAENAHYQSLPEPYDCKNGNLDSVEELLLIRGVTPEIFFGKRGEKVEEGEVAEPIGFKDVFSIYSSGEQIDINSAALPVLKVVLGIPYGVAQQIIKAREEKGFDTQQDLLQRVPELSLFIGEAGKWILFRATVPYYTIEARAKGKEGGARRGIKTILKIDPKEKRGCKIVQWVDFFTGG